ncbi:butyrophilin subfamily 2 member A1-like [Anabas testudineus]|uniref:Ig-like domain-containing protein n=1 Tax=Anabas testudineus TaxID=64144 RepID=A0A3Q1IMD8_ANATE|nr:butyrophilin subfamily 2 member A1-like [Anabas testudineus]
MDMKISLQTVAMKSAAFPETARPTNVGWCFSVLDMKLSAHFFLVATLLSCCVTSCAGQSLKNGVPGKIIAFTGQSVILPCSTSVNNDQLTVEWSKEGLNPNIVFLYRHGCETFEEKNRVFLNRVNLFLDKVTSGNISLMISNVQLMDAGKYQCMIVWMNNPKVENILELVVGAASEPKLSVIPGLDGGVTLQCEANCWFPEPEVTFVDDQGKRISGDNPRRKSDESGCFTVTRRATVKTPINRVTCRVHEPQMNNTRDTEIYIPDDCFRSCTVFIVLLGIIILIGLCTCVSYLWKNNVGRQWLLGQSEKISNTDCQRNQDDVITELQRENEKLRNELHDKNCQIQTATEELKDLRSRQGPVLQHSQPTINKGPSTSFPGASEPIHHAPQESHHDSNTKPPGSSNSNHPNSANLPKEDSKPEVSRQNPASGPPAKRSSRHKSSPALFVIDDAPSSSSSSSSTSEKKHRVRTKSESLSCPNPPRSPRRHTISPLCNNRYTVLGELTESDTLLLCDQN